MRVRLISADPGLGPKLHDELSSSGVLVARDLSDPDVLLIDGAVASGAGLQERIDAELRSFARCTVFLLALPEQAACPPEHIDAMAIAPARPGELAGRLQLLGRLRREQATPRDVLLAHAVETAADIIEIATPDSVYEYVNPAFERVLGYTLDEVVGRTPSAVIRSDMHEPGFFRNIETTLRAGKTWKGLLISRAKDGRLVYLEGTVTPLRDDTGKITHHIAVKRDITARIAAEKKMRRKGEELEQARDAAVAASRSKSQFLANMSHELRTPLNAIIGYAEMLSEDAEQDERARDVADLGKIRKAGEHLLALINDVLDISKIEAGAMSLHLETFDLRTAVTGVVATIEPLARERGNTLTVAAPEDLGVMRADLTKVRQALLNLLSNACKFTEDGNVMLVVRNVTSNGRNFVEFRICDTGIGINPDQLKRLFRPFEQADASTTRKYGGTGLGLAISQRYCQMMGGGIEAVSQAGQGSTFTVLLPQTVEDPDEAPAPAVAVRPAGDKPLPRVLVIDDDPTIVDLLSRSLHKHGFDVLSAVNGEQGLARAKALRPDAIVLDVMMPELDGWGVLTALKADPETSDIPVVLQTVLEQSDLGFSLGAVDYLVKPVQTERLAAVLRRHCHSEAASILLVDDDETTRHRLRRILESTGHTVREAVNGATGLEELSKARPDLLVLDLMMPVLDGFGVLEHIRQEPALADLPVVVVTSKDLSPQDRAMLRGARAVFERGGYARQELFDAVAQRVTDLLG